MKYPKIEFENGFVFYQDHNTGDNFESIRLGRECFCPICNEMIKNNQDCYLGVTNNLFPNVFIHKECVSRQFDYLLKEYHLKSLTSFLFHEYNRYKYAQASIENQFKAWL